MSNQTAPTAVCQVCQGTMVLARVVPKLGPYPELRTFKCEVCGEVDTRSDGGWATLEYAKVAHSPHI